MSTGEGPFIAAMLCERVLEEKDGVKTVVRIIDRVTRQIVGPTVPAAMEPFDYPLTLFIKLTPGNVHGTYGISIHIVDPSGDSEQVGGTTVNFEGQEDRGADIVGPIPFKATMPGVFWFEIYLEDRGKHELLTRLPFRVIYLPRIIAAPRPG